MPYIAAQTICLLYESLLTNFRVFEETCSNISEVVREILKRTCYNGAKAQEGYLISGPGEGGLNREGGLIEVGLNREGSVIEIGGLIEWGA